MSDIGINDTDDSQDATPQADNPSELVRKWLIKVDLAQREEKEWRTEVKDISEIHIPRPGKKAGDFNILYSNTEILLPSLYSQTPKADVRRRFGERDPVGKIASMALERTLDYEIDAYDFDYEMECCVLDGLIGGRGLVRVRYVPVTQPILDQTTGAPMPHPDTGEPMEEITDEYTTCEYVKWRDFVRSPGKVWADVLWVGFRNRMKKEEVKSEFPDIDINKLNFDYQASTGSTDESEKNFDESASEKADKRVTVWEVWDKVKKQVLFLAPSYKDAPLKVMDDPLELKNFYPIPRPLQFMLNTNSLIPTPEYKQYEKQAKQLNEISRRILYITKALKVRGVYDSTMAELQRLFDSDDNQMIPAENVTAFIEKGGIEKMIWMMPIQEAANVLNILYQQRETCKQSIYDISGISDVMRGDSKASETLGAQQLKANFGSVRLKRKQRELQRFIRDLIRMKAEIISEHFQVETIAKIANITPDDLQKAMAGMQPPSPPPAAPGQPPAPPPPPPMVSLDDVGKLLKDENLSKYRIGIQTDSTIAAEDVDTQQTMTSFLQGMSQFFAMITPAVEAQWIPIEAAKGLMTAVARKFKMGEVFEDALEQMQAPPPKQPDPIKMAEVQIKGKKVDGDLALGNKKLNIEAGDNQQKNTIAGVKVASDHVNKGHQVLADHMIDQQANQIQADQPPPQPPQGIGQ